MADCLIGLGSNLGDRAVQLDQAISRICDGRHITLRGVSNYHETVPIGGPAGQGSFLNAALRVTTDYSPFDLLARLQHVEQELGRQRRERWGPRSIDIDLLLVDTLIVVTPDLILPHPRMAVRRFVLQGACEVAAEMIHAPTGWTLGTLLARLDDQPCYVALCGADQRDCRNLTALAARELPGVRLLRMKRKIARPDVEPPGRGPQAALRAALDALAEQQALLASVGAPRAARGLVLSEFWLNQSLALARTWPPGAERTRLQRACRAAIKRAPAPRFILHLDQTPHPVSPASSCAPADDDRTAPSVRASLAHALRRQVAIAGQGPVLSVAAGDPHAAWIELKAGIDAMR